MDDVCLMPPHNVEAEQSVIGSMLLNPSIIGEIIEFLTVEEYYKNNHAVIHSKIIEMYNADEPVDILTLTTALRIDKKLEIAGGAAYLSYIFSNVPTSVNWKQHSLLIKNTAILRKAILFGQKIKDAAYAEPPDINEFIDKIQGYALKLSTNIDKEKHVHEVRETIPDVLNRIEELQETGKTIWGIDTGFKEWNECCGGLHDGDFTIIAGRPSDGKTAFALSLCLNMWMQGKKVYFQSCEMPKIQLVQRLLAMQSKLHLYQIRSGNFSAQGWKDLTKAASQMMKDGFVIADKPAVTVPAIKAELRKRPETELVVIDYLQLLLGIKGNYDSNVYRVSEISRDIKLLARAIEVPVVVLSQLNRNIEYRPGKEPQLSDLRDSGSIEQDADNVFFITTDKIEQESRIWMKKVRNGPVGDFYLNFDLDTTFLSNDTKNRDYITEPLPEKSTYPTYGGKK